MIPDKSFPAKSRKPAIWVGRECQAVSASQPIRATQ
jgi:hypothetical protein